MQCSLNRIRKVDVRREALWANSGGPILLVQFT